MYELVNMFNAQGLRLNYFTRHILPCSVNVKMKTHNSNQRGMINNGDQNNHNKIYWALTLRLH